MDELVDVVSLPRSGEDLSKAVSNISKTCEVDESETSLASLIHQAMVRRYVVVKLTVCMECRGHRAYRNVDMDNRREKAERLPTDSVPPESLSSCLWMACLIKFKFRKAQHLCLLLAMSKKQLK